MATDTQTKPKNWRGRLHDVIYESNTPAGKAFDIALLVCITLSIIVVMFDSVPTLNRRYREAFFFLEWGFSILFTIEYILRLLAVRKPWLYMTSFLGVIDLLAIIPSYLRNKNTAPTTCTRNIHG